MCCWGVRFLCIVKISCWCALRLCTYPGILKKLCVAETVVKAPMMCHQQCRRLWRDGARAGTSEVLIIKSKSISIEDARVRVTHLESVFGSARCAPGPKQLLTHTCRFVYMPTGHMIPTCDRAPPLQRGRPRPHMCPSNAPHFLKRPRPRSAPPLPIIFSACPLPPSRAPITIHASRGFQASRPAPHFQRAHAHAHVLSYLKRERLCLVYSHPAWVGVNETEPSLPLTRVPCPHPPARARAPQHLNACARACPPTARSPLQRVHNASTRAPYPLSSARPRPPQHTPPAEGFTRYVLLPLH